MRKLLALAVLLYALPLAVYAATFTRPLSLGSTGTDVTSLQQILQTDGYLSVAPTGYFGPLTQAAVEEYQSAKGIVSSGTPDTTGYGDVGPKTLASLNGTPTSTNPNQPLIDQLLAEVKALEAQIAAILAGQTTTTPSTTTGGATAGTSGISLPSQAQVPPSAGGGGGGGSVSVSGGGSSSSGSSSSSSSTGNTSTSGSSNTTSSACPRGTSYQDGCTSAPTGVPQLPTLLNGYATRPPWNVAGVDYAVGYPSGTVLTDWENLSGPGISVSTTGHYVRVDNTNGATFDHVDFSLHGGAYLFFVNSPNGKVLNSNFGGPNLKNVGSWVIQADANSPGLTVDNTVMDGAGPGAAAALVGALGGGTVQLHYDWFKNFPQQVIEFGNPTTTIDYQYNLIEDGGQQPGAHLNYQQLGIGPFTITTQFNTSVQHPEAGPGEGYQFYNGVGGPITLTNASLAYNTMLAVGTTTAMSYLIHGSGSGAVITGSASAHDNYFDPTATYAGGSGAVFYPNSFSNWTGANNMNMVTGQQVPNDASMSSGTPPPPPADTTPPVITITAPSGQLAAGTTQATLSVTTNESATCAWSNTAGTAFASMISFTTTGGTSHSTTLSSLTNGSSYTTYVKCKDAAGNISADSSTSYSIAQSTTTSSGTTSSSGTTKVIFLTSGTTWTVPSDWNSANNTVALIGGGASGHSMSASTGYGVGGGGGGAFASAANVALAPGATITIQIGQGGFASGSGGATDTIFNSTATSCIGVSLPALCAQGGKTSADGTAGGAGGAASASVGTVTYSGGAGGSSSGSTEPDPAGGGGAAGPNGNGGAGGSAAAGNNFTYGGSGGGGNGGGSVGGSPTSGGTSGAGGNSAGGTGGAAGAAQETNGVAGTNGGGGSGGGFPGWNVDDAGIGGMGGSGTEWDATHGSGGGGGGAGDVQGASFVHGVGGNGGLYGAGGGGGNPGGNGAQGIIVITYTP